MKMSGHHKREYLTSKARLYFEVYGQRDKITPKAGEKRPLLNQKFEFLDLKFFPF